MKTTQRTLFPAIAALVLATVACTCGALGGTGKTPTPTVSGNVVEPTDTQIGLEPSPTDTSEAVSAPTETSVGTGDATPATASAFPLPDDAKNVVQAGGTTNFQTGLSLKDALAFYQDAFTKKGYTERTLLHVVSDTTFSIVFDGDPSGQATVVQAVDLSGSTNINIRLESIP
jgi:hypothetical protein